MSGEKRTSDMVDVRYVARLARLQLTEEEIRSFEAQLAQVADYVRAIREPDVTGVEPTAHATAVRNVFREDEVRPGLDHETVMTNAPVQRDGLFLVPRIVE